jgi:hypothetical protein
MEVFITKYALSNCILKCNGIALDNSKFQPGMLDDNFWDVKYFYKPDWHITYQSAVERAEEMKRINIENLIKEIDSPSVSNSEIKECEKRIEELEKKQFRSKYLKPEILAQSENDALKEFQRASEGFFGTPCEPGRGPGGFKMGLPGNQY